MKILFDWYEFPNHEIQINQIDYLKKSAQLLSIYFYLKDKSKKSLKIL